MGRLYWRIEAEMVWHDNLPALASSELKGLKGKARVDVVKAREWAQSMIRSMFPADED